MGLHDDVLAVYASHDQALADAVAARASADAALAGAQVALASANNRADDAEARVSTLEATVAEQVAAYALLDAEYADHLATHETETPAKTWFLGMSTEKAEWDDRLTDLGRPVNVRRRFRSSWSVAGTVALAEECHASGCLPYVSAKMSPSTWQQVANGALDGDAELLGSRLAALGYRVRVTFHHEPRPASVSELVTWGQALTRIFTRMRTGAGIDGAKRLILGGTDNGFPWGDSWTGGVSEADLDRYYTDAFLGACDVVGADFYDGATDSNEGEPAWIKMRNFADYFDRRGFVGLNDPGWKYDAGEYQIVDPEDCDALWAFLNTPAGADFNCLSIFNSGANNRPDLPSRLGGSWVLAGARLAAFKAMLAAADVEPITT